MDLDQKPRKFKKLTTENFKAYKASEMATSKWRAHNHLVEDIAVVGGIDYLSANAYESSHKLTKSWFKQTLKQRATATEEVTNRSQHLQLCRNAYVLNTREAVSMQKGFIRDRLCCSCQTRHEAISSFDTLDKIESIAEEGRLFTKDVQ